jgi:hypothetical protein
MRLPSSRRSNRRLGERFLGALRREKGALVGHGKRNEIGRRAPRQEKQAQDHGDAERNHREEDLARPIPLR